MDNTNRNENVIVKLSFEFALAILEYCEELEDRRKFVVANQLLKAGTSVGANVREAQHAESKADFIHKLKIAMKEAEETSYWLELCQAAKRYPDCVDLLEKIAEVKRVLSKIIISMKAKP